MKHTSKVIMTIAIFCVSLLVSIILIEELAHVKLTVELDDKDQKHDILQIFWRSENESFSGNKSGTFEIHHARYTFSQDLGNLATLPAYIRLDPTSNAGHVQIMRVCFNLLLPLYCIASGNDFKMVISSTLNIDDLQYEPGGISVQTQQQDPQIELFTPPEVSQRVFALEMFSAVLFSSVVTAGFRKLYTWVFSPRRRRSEMESYTNYVKERQR